MIARAADGYYHPASEDEIVDLVQHARAQNLKICVRGSAHSVEAAIYTGDFSVPPPAEQHINIYLDRMTAVSFDDDKQQVTVQAVCSGVSSAPSTASSSTNSCSSPSSIPRNRSSTSCRVAGNAMESNFLDESRSMKTYSLPHQPPINPAHPVNPVKFSSD